jgi:hypothetical protein
MIEDLMHVNHKEKNSYSLLQHTITWEMFKSQTHGVEIGAEIQTKGIGNIFNEISAKNFQNLCNDLDTHVHEAF